jgi:TPR repeat protein
VADFGLSKFVDPGATLMQTMRGGTLPYMAPEIFETSEYSFPVDVYAFGILVYVCVTLMAPFAGQANALAIGRDVAAGKRPKLPDWIYPAWTGLIMSCWDQDRKQRPTFEHIVKMMGSASFLDPAIDKRVVLAYQQRTLSREFHLKGPLSAPAPLLPRKKPFERLRDAADGGDGHAALEYALMLRKGDGVSQDEAKAAEYFRRAAQAGEVQGMIEWGKCCEEPSGVQQNYSEAARWYKAAMDRGSAEGGYCYADMLENGKGVAKDSSGAARCYKQAADAGHDRAQMKYGLILENGSLGVTKNLSEAVRYYKMASDQGSPRGMFCYAEMLENGKGVPKNMSQAVLLYALSAQKGCNEAIGYLGWLLFQGNGVSQNVEKGLMLIVAAAEAGDPSSIGRLAAVQLLLRIS